MARVLCSSHEDLGSESCMTKVEEYLTELSDLLNVGRKKRTEILEEVRDHLLQSVQNLSHDESSLMRSEMDALTAFGPPILIASQFNAEAGAKAMRRAPLIAITSGASVVISFLIAVINQPKTTAPANLPQQITFFLSVIAFQFALLTGLFGLTRTLSTWKTSVSSGAGRTYVKNCITFSMSALTIGAVSMAANFFFDAHQGTPRSRDFLLIGALLMTIVAVVGLTSSIKLHVNASCENIAMCSDQPRALIKIWESIINLVRRFPFSSLLFGTVTASAWVILHAETSTFVGALPWGVAEAVAVVAGFLFLGPILGLRPPLRRAKIMRRR